MPKFAQDILKDIEMDDEFREIVEKYSDKELTPMEMDLKVRMDRVIYILNRTLAMIKVMVHLPLLLENDAEVLKKYMTSKDSHFILRLLNKYGTNFDLRGYKDKKITDYSDMLDKTNVNRKPHRYTRYCTPDVVPNPHISQMINLIFNNKCIRDQVKAHDQTLINSKLCDFLNTMEEFKKVAKAKIYETGEEEDVKNKELRQAYKHNVLVVASIKELEQRLEKQRSELGEQLNKKVAVFTMYNKKMQQIKNDFQLQIGAKLADSEKDMMNETVISEEKQVRLAEEAKIITKQYEVLMEDHIEQEKQTRSKRFKTETQLQNWLIKYDQDIGDRQTEFESVKAKYDEEKVQLEALEEMYEDQTDEYTYLMQEKAEEEERIYNEMAYHFLMSRSARTIQRAWKAYLLRKKSRRKGKKGKGKGGKGKKGKDYLASAMKRTISEKIDPTGTKYDDPNALLSRSRKFKPEVFDEIQNPNAFDTKDVDLGF